MFERINGVDAKTLEEAFTVLVDCFLALLLRSAGGLFLSKTHTDQTSFMGGSHCLDGPPKTFTLDATDDAGHHASAALPASMQEIAVLPTKLEFRCDSTA